MLSLYKTLVRPRVVYCSSAWNPPKKNRTGLTIKFNYRILPLAIKLYSNI